MKILKLFNDVFGELPTNTNIYNYLIDKAKSYTSYEKFFNNIIGYVGGRGYNEFLDYGLFALKLNSIFKDELGDHVWDNDGNHISVEMTNSLLHDDRHDLWQNIPYSIEKSHINDKWKLCSIALIESINVNGTGDISYKLTH